MAATKDTANSPVNWLSGNLLGSMSRPIVWLWMAIFIAELTLMSNEAAGQQVAEKPAHGLTCNLDGIPSQERARYTELFESLRHAIRDKRELPDGYALLLTRLNLLWIKHSSGPSSNESAVHSSRCKFAGISRTGPCGLI